MCYIECTTLPREAYITPSLLLLPPRDHHLPSPALVSRLSYYKTIKRTFSRRPFRWLPEKWSSFVEWLLEILRKLVPRAAAAAEKTEIHSILRWYIGDDGLFFQHQLSFRESEIALGGKSS